jgi:uncharacterized protein DUF3443
MTSHSSRRITVIALAAALLGTFGCGSSSTPSGSSGNNGGGGGQTSNVQPISVNAGPASEVVDGAFTSVTVCSPGSATNCQTISGILIDTGSSGLRIFSSALSINLTQQTDGSGNPIVECAQFGSGTTWGPVQTGDVKIAGEVANSMPIQIISSPSFPTVPQDCQGVIINTVADFGANGLLGIGQSIQDCGEACTSTSQPYTGVYYDCPASGCTDTTESLALQVQNPVASFATDNNGTIIELPSVTGGEASLSGSLIFGIGTQSNNGLGGATVFGTDDSGDFNTEYNGTTYLGFLDSGSNGIYFLNQATTGILPCTTLDGQNIDFLYCPTSTQTISITNTAEAGTNNASGGTSFAVANAVSLLTANSGGNAAINGLAGPFTLFGTTGFDLGLPFFFGHNVYTAIVGKSTPGGTGPYTAY